MELTVGGSSPWKANETAIGPVEDSSNFWPQSAPVKPLSQMQEHEVSWPLDRVSITLPLPLHRFSAVHLP
jgi:hypothetical protein